MSLHQLLKSPFSPTMFSIMSPAVNWESPMIKGTSGLPQQQACDVHVTDHDDAGVLTKRIIQMSHLPCKLKQFKAE